MKEWFSNLGWSGETDIKNIDASGGPQFVKTRITIFLAADNSEFIVVSDNFTHCLTR